MQKDIIEYASYLVPIIPLELIGESSNNNDDGKENEEDKKDVGTAELKQEIQLLKDALRDANEIIRSRQQGVPKAIIGGYADKILNDQLRTSTDAHDSENRRVLLFEILGLVAQQLGLSKAELRDSVVGFRQMMKETVLTRESERASHMEQDLAIEKIQTDMLEFSRITEGEKEILKQKIQFLAAESEAKDTTISQLKQSLRDAIKTKGVELQKVLEAHAKQKTQHAKELSRLSRAHDDNLVDHEATRVRRDELLAQLLKAQADSKDLQGRLDGANRLIGDLQEQLRVSNSNLNAAREDAKRREAELNAQLSEAKRQVHELVNEKGSVGEQLARVLPVSKGETAANSSAAMSQSVGKLLEETGKLRDENGKLVVEVDSLKSQLSEVKPAIERANSARDAALLAAGAANKRADQVQREMDEKDDMHRAEKSLMNRKIDELGREGDRLKDQNKTITRQLDKVIGDHALEIADLTTKFNGQLADMDEQVGTLKEKTRDLSERLVGTGADAGALKGELDSKDKKIDELEDSLDKELRKVAELGAELAGTKKTADERKALLAAALAEKKRLEGELEVAQETIAEDQKKIDLLGASVNHLQGEADRARAKASERAGDPDAPKRVEELNRQLDSANRRIAELMREIAELKRSSAAGLADKDFQLRELQDTAASLRAQINELNEAMKIQKMPPGLIKKILALLPLLGDFRDITTGLEQEIQATNSI